MPELPEVETIRRKLKNYLVGHRIEGVEVLYRGSLESNEDKLVGGKIIDIRRFGKVLVIDLGNDYSALVHVKMTGQFIYRGPNLKKPPILSKKVAGGVPGKHTHVVFHLDQAGVLYFNDVRKFGWIKVVRKKDVEKVEFIKKLGPEPLDSLSLEKFREAVSKTSRSIKVLLMDQAVISGIGNIYANDALWLAGIDPRKSASKLKEAEIKKLYRSIETVLKSGLKYSGTSDRAYVTPDGSEGEYQKHYLVYNREGKECARCKKVKIKKDRMGGRGTYYCPACQA